MTTDEKRDWIRQVAINTIYSVLHTRINDPESKRLELQERDLVEFMGKLYADMSQGGQAADIEEALTTIATAKIKEKYQ